MSTFNACKSAVAEGSIKYWRLTWITRMTADNKKSYLGYFNKLVDEYNNSYHHSIDKKTHCGWLFRRDWKASIKS